MRRSLILQSICFASILAAVSGCALMSKPSDSTVEPIRETVGRPPRMTRDTIQLEVLLLDRPVNDPLLGQILWDDVDEIGAVELDVRERLNSNGIRVGVAGTAAPQALQTILESSRPGLTFLPEDDRRLSNKPPITLIAGTDTLVNTTPPSPREFKFADSSGQTDATDERPNQFDNAVCAFRIKANRLQDGWAKLEFIPEIHHGENALRHHANEIGWEMRASQEVMPLYDQKFEMMLNVGETALISCGKREKGSPGVHFFTTPTGEQRLLVVRLTDLGSVEGVSQGLR